MEERTKRQDAARSSEKLPDEPLAALINVALEI